MKKIVLLTFGHIFLALGIIGAFLPILPTTPFLLLAAYFYSKSNSKIHTWMLQHKYLGPPLSDWQQNGVIGIKAKILAATMILLIICWRIPSLEVVLTIKIIASSILFLVLVFVCSRPSKRPKS